MGVERDRAFPKIKENDGPERIENGIGEACVVHFGA